MSTDESLEQQARDPHTEPQVLYQLAANHPELRPLIAGNPNTYPALRAWLADLGDAEIIAALEAREAEEAKAAEIAAAAEAETALLDPVDAPDQPPAYAPAPATQVVRRSALFPAGAPQSPPEEPIQTPSFVQTPAAPEAPAEEPQPKRNTWLIAIFIVLALIAAVATVLTVYLLLGGGDVGEPGDAASPTATAPATETAESAPPSQSPSPSESPTKEEPKYPAPTDAVESSWFVSPSANIACRMWDSAVDCSIFENNYADAGYPDCDGQTVTLRIDDGGAQIACGSAAVGTTADVLVYDTSSAVGDYACTSTENGINCWNIMTGDSFIMARDGWTIGDSGPTSPSKYPWL